TPANGHENFRYLSQRKGKPWNGWFWHIDYDPETGQCSKFGPVRGRNSYALGLSQQAVAAAVCDSCLVMCASRPSTGGSKEISRPAGSMAMRFERSHAGTAVAKCDVYWLGHYDAPGEATGYAGVDLTYFYFDGNDKMMGYETLIFD